MERKTNTKTIIVGISKELYPKGYRVIVYNPIDIVRENSIQRIEYESFVKNTKHYTLTIIETTRSAKCIARYIENKLNQLSRKCLFYIKNKSYLETVIKNLQQ